MQVQLFTHSYVMTALLLFLQWLLRPLPRPLVLICTSFLPSLWFPFGSFRTSFLPSLWFPFGSFRPSGVSLYAHLHWPCAGSQFVYDPLLLHMRVPGRSIFHVILCWCCFYLATTTTTPTSTTTITTTTTGNGLHDTVALLCFCFLFWFSFVTYLPRVRRWRRRRKRTTVATRRLCVLASWISIAFVNYV